jgi:uncharacterized protein YkwD
MTPEKFAASEAGKRDVDFANPDEAVLSAAIFHETNRRRAGEKLPPLRRGAAAERAAVMHAKDMAAGNYLSHENPDDPKRREPVDRVRLAGLKPTFAAENIATTFAIRYESGRPFFASDGEPGQQTFRYERNGKPIPPHTYASLAAAVVEQWMNSPGHRKNMLSKDPRSLGGAAAPGKPAEGEVPQFYCVQVFTTP